MDTVLTEFGRYFLIYCLEHGYDHMLRTLGGDIISFIQNLDSLHALLALSYTGIEAPSFRQAIYIFFVNCPHQIWPQSQQSERLRLFRFNPTITEFGILSRFDWCYHSCLKSQKKYYLDKISLLLLKIVSPSRIFIFRSLIKLFRQNFFGSLEEPFNFEFDCLSFY